MRAPEPILALSLHQPYAALIALGLKRYETRTWPTAYRGPLAICAAKKWDPRTRAATIRLSRYFGEELSLDPPRGVVVLLAELVGCEEMTASSVAAATEREREAGGWEPGRFAWRLENVRALEDPLPIKGQQGLWTLTASQASDVRERLPRRLRPRPPGGASTRPLIRRGPPLVWRGGGCGG